MQTLYPHALNGPTRIAAITDLCKRLHVAAECGDWDAATRLEAELRAELEATFAVTPAPDQVERLTVCASEALSTIAAVTALAAAARTEAAEQLDKLDRGRRAQKGYGQP